MAELYDSIAPRLAPIGAVSRTGVIEIGNRWFDEFPTGLERYYYDLVRHLPITNFDVTGLVLADGELPNSEWLQVARFASPSDRLKQRIFGLRRCVDKQRKQRNVALIACHYPPYAFALADTMARVPTVIHFHGPWSGEGKIEGDNLGVQWTKHFVEHVVYHRAAWFIVLSDAFRDLLCSTYRVPAHLVSVVPGGIDLRPFTLNCDKTAARIALGLPSDRPIVLTIRRLVRRMGLENLIDSMVETIRTSPDALLLIGGVGPVRRQLEGMIERYNFKDNVRLLGRVANHDLPLLYRAADFSILPSSNLEGFGLTAAESLACGTPVLVTPVGGLPEVVRDLSSNLILRGSEPGDIAEGLIAALRGTLKLPSTDECERYARQRFDWFEVARKIGEVYSALI